VVNIGPSSDIQSFTSEISDTSCTVQTGVFKFGAGRTPFYG